MAYLSIAPEISDWKLSCEIFLQSSQKYLLLKKENDTTMRVCIIYKWRCISFNSKLSLWKRRIYFLNVSWQYSNLLQSVYSILGNFFLAFPFLELHTRMFNNEITTLYFSFWLATKLFKANTLSIISLGVYFDVIGANCAKQEILDFLKNDWF